MLISEVGCESGSEEIAIEAYDDWKLVAEYKSSDKNWAKFSTLSGGAGRGKVTISYGKNTSGRTRSVRIVMQSDGRVRGWDFSQSSHSTKISSLPSSYHEDPVANWMELPAVSTADGLYFFTHEHDYGGRDWSYYWDTKNLVAHWVAYPLNYGLIGGSGGRTDSWGVKDSHLPDYLQPILKDYYTSGGYQRGHQIPSADRNRRNENIRTFYGTNMTPQNGGLNKQAWAKLEDQVRKWSYRFDTLYVVTGCTVSNKIGTTQDNEGKNVTIPGGYFKALLGYSKNRTASAFCSTTGGYTGVGFYFDNEYCRDFEGKATTIRNLEKRVGMDFFVNLLSEIDPEKYEKVETGRDDFWY